MARSHSPSNTALATALRRVPGYEKGAGECICVFTFPSRPEMFGLHRVRICDSETGLLATIRTEVAHRAYITEFLEFIAGEDAIPIFLCKARGKGEGDIFRYTWVLVASDLTFASVNEHLVMVGFNPT